MFTQENNKWELVDGLQRISTVLQFMGLLVNPDKTLKERFVCDGTVLVPSLQGMMWPTEDDAKGPEILPIGLQIGIRRARVRVEILGQETDPHTKYELFQRLNTGGAQLSEQEIRSCVIVSINKQVMSNIRTMMKNDDFLRLTNIGEERAQRQFREELIVRFVVLRHFPYIKAMDVHEFLDDCIIKVCEDNKFDWTHEKKIFYTTMKRLVATTNAGAFKKNSRFSLGLYEFISLGLSRALESGGGISEKQIKEKIEGISKLSAAEKYSGPGIRGTQRLANFVSPLAEKHFKV